MTSDYHDSGTPQVGALREPKPETYTSNLMWHLFSQEMLDNSVEGWKEITVTADNLGTKGPHIFNLPALHGLYLHPGTIRVYGKAKIIFTKTAAQQPDDDLPLQTDTEQRPTYRVDDERMHVPRLAPDGTSEFAVIKSPHAADIVPEELISIQYPHYDNLKAKVGVVNSFNQALFKDVNVQMNEHSVTQNANLEYAHKVYLSQLMSYKQNVQTSHLDTEIWDLDEIHEKNDIETNAWKRRRDLCTENGEFDFCMQVPTELHCIPGIIIDNVNYRFAFYRTDPNFALLAKDLEPTGSYQIDIREFKLTARYMRPIASLHNQIQARLRSRNTVCDFVRTDLVSRQILPTVTNFEFGNCFPSAQLPDQVFMFLVDSDAKNGALNKDPFYFEHCDMNYIVLQFNGNNIPAMPYTPDFANKLIARELRGLYDNVNVLYRNESLVINRERFLKGFTLMAWDLNPDLCGGGHWNHKPLQGSISVKINFKAARDYNITCCLMGIYRDKLVVTTDRIPIIKSTYDEMELAFKPV